jgi:virulence-associated protein VagC
MKTTEVISIDGRQAVTLPSEFQFTKATVSIRKEGEAVILEPVKCNSWPEGFFEDICIDDRAFARPSQGDTPPAPAIESQ